MDEQKGIVKEFIRLATITFTCVILAKSIVGWLFGNEAEGVSAIFALGDAGLSYPVIFQIFILAAVNSLISVLITSSVFFKKIMMLWNMIATMFACLLASSILVISFNWIPRDSVSSWVWFIGSFLTIFVVISVLIVVKIKLEDSRYNDLLLDYKKRQIDEK